MRSAESFFGFTERDGDQHGLQNERGR